MRKYNLILLLPIICLSGCAISENTQKNSTETKIQEQSTTKTQITTQPTTTQVPTTTQAPTTQTPTTTQPTTQEPTTVPEHRTGENIIGISEKNAINVSFSARPVRNDKTGKWKISTIADNIDIAEYALSYYKKYFRNDSEVHAIVNFNYNTTTCITCLSGILYVDTYEYVKGEEHDANILFSGTHLSEVLVYIDNGDIENVFN